MIEIQNCLCIIYAVLWYTFNLIIKVMKKNHQLIPVSYFSECSDSASHPVYHILQLTHTFFPRDHWISEVCKHCKCIADLMPKFKKK